MKTNRLNIFRDYPKLDDNNLQLKPLNTNMLKKKHHHTDVFLNIPKECTEGSEIRKKMRL